MTAHPISLRGYYIISVTATAVGVMVVFLLNVTTPVDFIQGRSAEFMQKTGMNFVVALIKRVGLLAGIMTVVCALSAVAMNQLLSPVSSCLERMKKAPLPSEELMERTRRRVINLPFISIAVNIGMWIVLPLFFFIPAWATGFVDSKTAMVFTARAFMVGMVASSLAFYRIEAHSRKTLIPFFFPQGGLSQVRGTARIPISRRIRMFFRLSTVVPWTILLVTLVTLQWGVESEEISAAEYGAGIIRFTLILGVIYFLISGWLSRLVSRSIVDPIKGMLRQVDSVRKGDYDSRVRVVSNDEIGILGDAGNRMIQGLAERETIRTAFGQYVTPEIRDEILSGRIPLQGELREATVLFADLRDFTPFVENNPPEEVISSMRSYFTAMHQAIRGHRGLVLQFAGDEIEAVFGVPLPDKDHADAALEAALDMRKSLAHLNRERSTQGKPPLVHGIGIHSGTVLAGNSGSEEQSAYSLIGNTVNIASRIQGLTKEVGCDILISRETAEQSKRACPMRPHPPVHVKGYSRPVTVYEITD